jgi:tRNA(fMet)-specific endonuclease VapC
MKHYMLDTDTCSYIIRERPHSVYQRFQQISMEQLHVSIITYAELLYGVERSSSQKTNRPIVEQFIRHLHICHWDEAAAEHYASIRTFLEKSGQPIGAMDMQIAAHARSMGAIVITNNTRHFSRVPDLQVENWVVH